MAGNRRRTSSGTRPSAGGGARVAPQGVVGRVDAGLARAAAVLERLSRRIASIFAPIGRIADSIAATFDKIGSAIARVAAAVAGTAKSLRDARDSLKQLPAKQGGVTSASGSAAQVATGAATGAAEGVASFAAAAAMPKIWAAIAGSSASVAATTATTASAVTATSASSATLASLLASSTSAAGGMLAAIGPALPLVAGIAAAGLAIYTVWKQLDSIWPGIVGDLAKAAQWLVELASATVRLVNPWTYIKGAINLVGRAVGLVRDGVVATAGAVRSLLVGAANAASAAWTKLSSLVTATAARVASIGRAIGSGLAAAGSAAARGLVVARDTAAALLEKLAYAGVAIAGMGAAIVGPLTMAAQRFGEAGDAMDRLAKRAGASAQAMSEWAYIADRTGVSTADLADAIAKVGGEKAFEQLVYEIASIEDPLQRAAVAEREFGSGWKALMPLFAQGADRLTAMAKEANALGLTFSGPAAASAAALARSYQLLRDGLQGLWQTVGQAVAPAIEDWNLLLVGAVKGAIAWAKANQPLIAQVFKFAEAAATAGAAVAAIASTIMPAIPMVLGLATAAAAGGAAWGRYGQSVMRVVGPIIAKVQELYAEVDRVFGGIGDAIRAGELELAVQIAWLGVQTAWTAGLSSLASVTGDAMGGILNALAAGDWQSAGEQAWAQVQIVFEQGMSTIEQLWADLKIGIDDVVTHVRQAWNTALDAIAAQIDKLIIKTSQMLAAVAQYDPTTGAAKAAEALNRIGTLRGDAAGANAALGASADERRKAIESDASAAKQARDARIAELRAQSGDLASSAAQTVDPIVANLQKRLDDALKKAAELRAKADAETKAASVKIGQRIQDGGVEGLKRSSSGATFSAAALVAMAGKGPSKMEQIGQQQLVKMDQQIEKLGAIEKASTMEFVS